jgi:hypothetical protein
MPLRDMPKRFWLGQYSSQLTVVSVKRTETGLLLVTSIHRYCPEMVIDPASIRLQSGVGVIVGEAVEVPVFVGVNVSVGVGVSLGVKVMVGVGVSVGVSVMVGVLDGVSV